MKTTYCRRCGITISTDTGARGYQWDQVSERIGSEHADPLDCISELRGKIETAASDRASCDVQTINVRLLKDGGPV